ncbi:MAG: methyltransferase regulatory domain-containing protein [Acidobacteria bacterium]|nr:methyltransferase regulatory domain-containing protein [Acidobacteriota bacterium]
MVARMRAPGISDYDAVAYPSYPWAQTHPDRLATMATLFGMAPPPVERARVLEIGCGDGGNLIPMGVTLPGAQFTGVDLAETAVRRGCEIAAALELRNVRLLHMDLTDVTQVLGEFDYIIAHGLYAWVPEPIRDKLLEVCNRNLAPEGVAFVSYNALPGGYIRTMVREMMLYHTRGMEEPGARVAAAKDLIRFLANEAPAGKAYRALMQSAAEDLIERQEGALFHDELAETYQPVWFAQFARHAARHHLQYLSEAQLFEMSVGVLEAAAADRLVQLAGDDVIDREQYLDFIKCRTFRQTLLCHEQIGVDRSIEPARLRSMLIASPLRRTGGPTDPAAPGAMIFEGLSAARLETDSSIGKAALVVLEEVWPDVLPFMTLLDQACARAGAGRVEPDDLARFLLRAYTANVIECHVHYPRIARRAGPRPLASPLARYQIQYGSLVTNLRHYPISLRGDLPARFLRLLDGTRDRDDLAREMAPHLAGEPGSIEEQIDRNLERVAERALLQE